MSAKIALCLDTQSCMTPELVGLDGELFDSQDWLHVVCTGDDARRELSESCDVEEAWVVSSDDVDAINLAATLKSDHPDLRVCLVGEGDGSMRSRAYTASIDEVASMAEFIESYRSAKARYGMKSHVRVVETLPEIDGRTLDRRSKHPEHHETPDASAEAIKPSKQVTASAKSRGFLLPVVSGGGGVGKSTMSTLSAIIAQRGGYRTLLLDYDLQFGDVASAIGASDAPALDELVARPELLEALQPRGGLPAVLAAPSRIEASELLAPSTVDLLNQLRMQFDVVVANTGSGWAEHHVVLLEQSSAALFLIDQRASSLRACKHALQLCNRCGIATSPLKFALNRCSKNALFTSIDVSCALRGAPVFELRDGGALVDEYFSTGSADQLVEEGNDLAVSLSAALAKLLPEGEKHLGSLTGEGRQRRSTKHRARRFLRGGEEI